MRNIKFVGLVLISAICLAVPHSFRLRHHSATSVWRSLKGCGTLQPIFKMAEIRTKPIYRAFGNSHVVIHQ